jgi:hypothetical protein
MVRHAHPIVFLAVIIAGSSALAAQAGEQTEILAWLERSSDSLNTYGDPADTMYMGGSPLFNERTGEFKDKFQYIIEHVRLPSPESLLVGGLIHPGTGHEFAEWWCAHTLSTHTPMPVMPDLSFPCSFPFHPPPLPPPLLFLLLVLVLVVPRVSPLISPPS